MIKDEKPMKRTDSCHRLIIICCVFGMILTIATVIFLDRGFLYFRTNKSNNIDSDSNENWNSYVLIYESDLVDGSSLTIDDLRTFENALMEQWQVNGVTVFSAQFIPLEIENNDRKRRSMSTNEIFKGDPLFVSLKVAYPSACISNDCLKKFSFELQNTITNMHKHMQMPVRFTDGQFINVHLTFSRDQQSAKDYMTEKQIVLLSGNSPNNYANEDQHKKSKRQTTDESSSNSSLVDIREPIFFPRVIGHFQLALKSNTSIVVVIGDDFNIYLSSQFISTNSPGNFSLVDLMVVNDTGAALIRDSSTDRYLHSYNDIRNYGYSRIRTHLESNMPCNANIMFWTFEKQYLQFYRGGEWFYDTVACLEPLTGLVRIWLVNGQKGLTALQKEYDTCGLAPLIPINYD